MHKKNGWILLWLLLFTLTAYAGDLQPTTVILVRHAEKRTDKENPDLTVAGTARAKELVHILGASGIKAIYTSQYLRTKRTAEPLAEALKLTPVEMDAAKTNELVKDILDHHAGEVVFIAGHSDTVPEIIDALGARVPPIGDLEYDNLYIVTIDKSRGAAVVHLKYGEPAG